MGNLATNPLPTMATLVMEMTILPLAISMWCYTPSLMSWALATALVLVWEIGISYCFNVHNPLSGLVGVDFTEATTILGVLVILCWLFALIGSFICWLLDVQEVLPFNALLPMGSASTWTVRRPKTDTREGEPLQLVSKSVTGLNRWSMVDLPRPYVHTLVTLFLFAVCVATPHLVYAFLMDDVGNNNDIALGCVIGIPIVGYIITFLFWFFWPDAYVWGPHERNYKSLGSRYVNRENSGLRKRDTAMANMRIYKTILVLAFIHVASIIILAFVRFTHTDVDWSWPAAVAVGGVILLVGIITAFVLYAFRNREADCVMVGRKARKNDNTLEDDNNEEDMIDDEADEIVDVEDNSTMARGINNRLYSSPSYSQMTSLSDKLHNAKIL